MQQQIWLPPSRLLDHAIQVLVVGAGGTGSQVAQGLAPLHMALKALGHPYGLDVHIMDPSNVREANIGRQPYYPADVGLAKSTVLASRINLQYGSMGVRVHSHVTADIEEVVNPNPFSHEADIIIGCVDTKRGRETISRVVEKCPEICWIDIGNRADDGQVVIGNGSKAKFHVPTVAHLFPEIIDITTPDDNEPSCSMAESLERQSLFINRECALQALDMLSRFLRAGLTHHARIINLASGRMNSIPICPETWGAMGYRHAGYNAPNKKAARTKRAA